MKDRTKKLVSESLDQARMLAAENFANPTTENIIAIALLIEVSKLTDAVYSIEA